MNILPPGSCRSFGGRYVIRRIMVEVGLGSRRK